MASTWFLFCGSYPWAFFTVAFSGCNFCHGVSFSSETLQTFQKHFICFLPLRRITLPQQNWAHGGPPLCTSVTKILIFISQGSTGDSRDMCTLNKTANAILAVRQDTHKSFLVEYPSVYLNQHFTDVLKHSHKNDMVDNGRWNCLGERKKGNIKS